MVNTKPHFSFFSFVKKHKMVLPLCCFIFCITIIACDNKPYIASVNGSKIYLDDYRQQLARKKFMLPENFLKQPDFRKRFEEEVLEGMITERIMLLRAQELNISVTDKELDEKVKEFIRDYGTNFSDLLAKENIKYERWKEDFRKEMIIQKLVEADVNAKIKVTDDEAEKYFNEQRSHYKTESRVRVAQIVVHDLSSAKKVEKRLKNGENFAAVAAEVSIGPEARNGGDLGFIARKTMPDTLDKTIFSMPINKISPIVQSSYGYHIFKVLDFKPGGNANFKDVKERVITDIRLQKENDAFRTWLEALKVKANVKKEKNMLGEG